MADLLQSSTTAATTTPTFYTNYLSDLASKGTAAGNSALAGSSAYDPNALQNQAYGNAAANVGNYQAGLAQAGQTLSNASTANIQGAAQPYLNAGTAYSGLSAAQSGVNSGLQQNTGASSANPYLNSGTSTNGLSQANPYLSSGMAQNTGASAANPYLNAGTATNGTMAAQAGVYSGLQQNTGSQSANPYLASGTSTSGVTQANPYLQAGTQGAEQLIGNYMNPYTKDVVNQIGAANQQNIAQNLSPGITAGAVGSGQFGSQRGANALSLGISNANIGALSQQTQALQSGYAQALAAAQAQRTNQLNAGSTVGQLQNQFNTNQINAGQISGTLQNQQAQQAINAGLGMGSLQSQYNTNQVNAGNIAGNLQNQQATNALTAGSTAGQLQSQYNTNQVNAGNIAGTLQNQQAQQSIAAGLGLGGLQSQYNTNQVNAGQVAGNAANQQGQLGVAASQQQALQAQQLQNQGLADTNALATLGGQKQALAQAKVMQPLDVLGRQAGIMSGAQLPTTTTQTSQGSPLSAIATLGSTAAGLFQTPGSTGTPGVSAGSNIINGLGSALSSGYNYLTGNNNNVSVSDNGVGNSGGGASLGSYNLSGGGMDMPAYNPYALDFGGYNPFSNDNSGN
jgi:hypothetical protein